MVPIHDEDPQEDGSTPQAFDPNGYPNQHQNLNQYEDEFGAGSYIPEKDEYAPNSMNSKKSIQPQIYRTSEEMQYDQMGPDVASVRPQIDNTDNRTKELLPQYANDQHV